jgi:hypothetical protein
MVWHVHNKYHGDNVFDQFGSLPHPMQKYVMPLIASKEGHLVPVGTAFSINHHGLLMTAGHVLSAAEQQGILVQGVDGKTKREYGLYALWVNDEQNEEGYSIGGLIPVQTVYIHKALDIGLCWLESWNYNGKPLIYPGMALDITPPSIGSHVCGFGYHAMKVKSQGDIDSSRSDVEYAQETVITTGSVMEAHQQYRDSAMLSFPCFRVDARFDHGMSGGPIINESGRVCGVICDAFDAADPEYISYGSLIWPALGMSVDIRFVADSPVARLQFLELVKRRIIRCEGPLDKLIVGQDFLSFPDIGAAPVQS